MQTKFHELFHDFPRQNERTSLDLQISRFFMIFLLLVNSRKLAFFSTLGKKYRKNEMISALRSLNVSKV